MQPKMQYTGRSLTWLQYANLEKIRSSLTEFSTRYDPSILAQAHGQVMRDVNFEEHVEMIQENVEWMVEHGSLQVNFSI